MGSTLRLPSDGMWLLQRGLQRVLGKRLGEPNVRLHAAALLVASSAANPRSAKCEAVLVKLFRGLGPRSTSPRGVDPKASLRVWQTRGSNSPSAPVSRRSANGRRRRSGGSRRRGRGGG